MRKVKQVNDYLILGFDVVDRAHQPSIGNYGIIPAGRYSGNLGFDIGKMIRTDIDTLEEAIKIATEIAENVLAYVCDQRCKYPLIALSQDDLDHHCEKCRLAKLLEKHTHKPARDTFVNAVPDVREAQSTKRLYALGLALDQECPENDCRVYKNIFNMARELDGAIDIVSGYPETVLRSKLHEKIRELREMWEQNYAILAYRVQHVEEGTVPGPWHPGTKEKSGYAAEALTGQGRRQAPPQP